VIALYVSSRRWSAFLSFSMCWQGVGLVCLGINVVLFKLNLDVSGIAACHQHGNIHCLTSGVSAIGLVPAVIPLMLLRLLLSCSRLQNGKWDRQHSMHTEDSDNRLMAVMLWQHGDILIYICFHMGE